MSSSSFFPLLQSESISSQNDSALCNVSEKRGKCVESMLSASELRSSSTREKSAPFLNKMKRSQSECLVDGGFRAQIGCQN